MDRHRVRTLLMGGQACILCGAAEFSRDIDIAVAVDARNLVRLRAEEAMERELDRAYWRPLRAELERMRMRRPRKGSRSKAHGRRRPR